MKPLLSLLILTTLLSTESKSQSHDLIGYWHNWYSAASPYIELDQVDSRYSIVAVSFAEAAVGSDYQMVFIPGMVSSSVLQQQIQSLKQQGQKVIISMGGANSPISLDNVVERDTFVASMERIINDYDFDGIDIDFEGSSLSTTGGTISTPTDQKIINLIDAIKTLQQNYFNQHQKHLMLTMAPETAFVQGGQSTFGGIWGAYLPVIEALRDSLDILSVQLYNSGSMYGLDGNTYSQGTADFIVAMTEATIHGFMTSGGSFTGLPESKIAVGLPACQGAAGGGYADSATVASAMRYLIGQGPQPGNYHLLNSSGYPNLRGMMTWSINWDAACSVFLEYAANYESIFGSTSVIEEHQTTEKSIYPNPANHIINFTKDPNDLILITDVTGKTISVSSPNSVLDISFLAQGSYFLKIGSETFRLVKIE
ncbi:MAG: T9SS type A sorting domain-containing protein [Bacteroidetes bacterium]|nr:T9SS type A sorting domain-containing protein [Bacteroidota bacterium]